LLHVVVIHYPERAQLELDHFATHEHIRATSRLLAKGIILVNHLDAHTACIHGAGKVHLLAFDQNFAFIRDISSAEDFHQGGLAGGIVAHQSQHFVVMEARSTPRRALDSAKVFLDTAQFHHRWHFFGMFHFHILPLFNR
jgi:hypothetical protein